MDIDNLKTIRIQLETWSPPYPSKDRRFWPTAAYDYHQNDDWEGAKQALEDHLKGLSLKALLAEGLTVREAAWIGGRSESAAVSAAQVLGLGCLKGIRAPAELAANPAFLSLVQAEVNKLAKTWRRRNDHNH